MSSATATPTPPASSTATATATTSTTEARDSALRVLVNNAIDLSRLIKVQKAVLRVHMPVVLPHQRTLFDASTMEDMSGEEDDEDLASREICCIVFPGLIKRGDESGAQLHFENIITKARVLCSPE
jgi:activating signal cointegrator complex subunit 1